MNQFSRNYRTDARSHQGWLHKGLKKVLHPGDYPHIISWALLFLRIVAGVFMLTHGYGKFLRLMGDEPIQFADPIGIGATASLVLAVGAEFFCSIFLIVGVGTRFSAIPLLITMLVAALIVHWTDPFIRKELPLLYAAIYLVFIFTGAGRYSVDHWIAQRL
jgi:putative oxidoreductase